MYECTDFSALQSVHVPGRPIRDTLEATGCILGSRGSRSVVEDPCTFPCHESTSRFKPLEVMSDTYYTVEAAVSSDHTVQGSRFLSDVFPVGDRETVQSWISAVRDQEPKATHHCSAYRLGAAGEEGRYDDDGEPSGTAGPPILRQIDARDLTNTLVVVTRYFGGTELGTGGLARAYGEAASRALDRASIVERVERIPIRVQFAYDDTSPAKRVIEQFDVEVMDSEYTEVTTLTVGVRKSELDGFVRAFTDALADRGEILGRGEKGDWEQ